MFKIFRSSDGLVSKYTHEDESETSIKVVPSKDTTLQGEVRINDRGKYTVFISSSKGCYLKCGFCDLTVAGVPYKRLNSFEVLSNLKQALLDKVAFSPEIKNRYIKLSWMGMGDALSDPQMVHDVSLMFLDWVMVNKLAAGLDGVDLSTSFPKVKNNWVEKFYLLNKALYSYEHNPNNKDGRSPFRLFYSLQSGYENIREQLVPNTENIEDSLKQLQKVKELGVTVVFHYVVLDGINDTLDGGERAVKLLHRYGFTSEELRFLRYNPHPDSPFQESARRFEFAQEMAQLHSNLKLQISEGKECRSACGQFMWGQDA